jgi:outer membrane protein OmpA-like peptidoglycan-associated protein
MNKAINYLLLMAFSLIFYHSKAQQSDTLHLYFEVNKSGLSVIEFNKINSFVEAHMQNTKEINIAAYADTTGSEYNNQILAVNRMEVVKTLLISINDSFKSIIKASAMSQTNKFGNDLAKNRCVELVFVQEEKQGINNLAAYTKGDKIVLENILFENNSHVFLPSSIPALQALLATLKANKDIKIMIQGHVCCGGNNPDYDLIEPGQNRMKISESRAKAVCDYLIENGIESERLKYVGFSFKFPRVFPENSEEDRAKNRRVEIEIL